MSVKDKFAGALVGAIAAGGVLGAGWAWAQEAPTTTTPPTTQTPSDNGTPVAPGTPAPDPGARRNCPNRDGGGQSDAPAPPASNTAINL